MTDCLLAVLNIFQIIAMAKKFKGRVEETEIDKLPISSRINFKNNYNSNFNQE